MSNSNLPEDYGDSLVQLDNESDENKTRKLKSPRVLRVSTAALLIILTVMIVLLVFIILYFSNGKNIANDNKINNIDDVSTLHTTSESTAQDLSAVSSEIGINNLECLKDIGKTLSTLQAENPNMVINSKTPSLFNGMAQLLGDYNGNYAYYFYTSNGFPTLQNIEDDGYENKIICAGIYTTVGELFANTTDKTKAQEFFEGINIDDYTYTSNNTLELGQVKFEYNGYLIVIDYSSEISDDTIVFGNKAQEEKDIPPQYIKSSYNAFVIDTLVDNSEVLEDWNKSQDVEENDYSYDNESEDFINEDEDNYIQNFYNDNSSRSTSRAVSSNMEKSSSNNKSSTSISKTSPSNTEKSSNNQTVPKVNVKKVNVKGVEFNYVNSYKYTAKYTGDTIDYKINLDIKYCEPSEYMSDNDKIIGISNSSGMYKESDIGSLYKSAGYDDFAVFEVKVSGNYTNEFYGYNNIEFRKYTSGGTLLENIATNVTDYEMLFLDSDKGTINEKFYIGFYKSEVGRVDFKILDVGPNGLGEW